MKKLWGSVAMVSATVLWGVAFSAQSTGMRFVDPMIFTALRSMIGVAALVVLIMAIDLIRERRLMLWGSAKSPAERKELIAGGIYCGIVITAASVCQQYGVKYTTAGKTGFLTALYIVIVPVLGLFFKRRSSPLLCFSVALALAGSYLLCGGIDSIGKGELFVISCAFIYSIHIMVIDRYAANCDCVRLSCIQFIVATMLSASASLISSEAWIWENIRAAMPFWLFCGIGSSALAFTLQMIAQKYLHPVTATLLMSLESVFAVLGGWLFLNERLSAQELCGCAVIFIAVIIAQIPWKAAKSEKK